MAKSTTVNTENSTKSAKNQLGLTPNPRVQEILSTVPKGGINKFVNAAIEQFATNHKDNMEKLAALQKEMGLL